MTHGNPGVFGPRTLAVMSRAYRHARRAARNMGAPDDGLAMTLTEERLAARIIERAKQGERNARRLAIYALNGVDSLPRREER